MQLVKTIKYGHNRGRLFNPLRLHSLCILQGGEGRGEFFKGQNFSISPTSYRIFGQSPHPVLTRKVKYGQYDEMVQRLMFKIEN